MICASPQDSEELFVGCDVGGFYRSRDGGRSYRISNTGLQDYYVECIEPHPRDPNVLYFGSSMHIFKTTDGGTTWKHVLKDRFAEGLAVDPHNADVVYIGLTCLHVTTITIDPDCPDRVYLGTGGNGVFVSTLPP